MTLQIVVDDGAPVPDRLRELIGIDSFGKLIFKRRTLAAITEQAAAVASLPPPLTMKGPADWARLTDQVRRADRAGDRFLVCPAGIIAGRGLDVLAFFLKQARYSPQNLVLPPPGGLDHSGWAVMIEPLFRDYLAARAENDWTGDTLAFFERQRGEFVRMEERLGLIDLSDEVTLLEFLSGTFDARFFNAIERDAYTVTKRSTDKAKLEREFKLFDMLTPAMQMFFIRPFDFRDEGKTASYRMERLFVPDMAVQWLHGALTETEFSRFLDHVLYFVSVRARRPAKGGEAEAVAEDLFVTKVRQRIDKLKTLPEYRRIGPMVDQACGGIDGLFARYLALFNRVRGRLPTDAMVIGHGDLCFSNILYAKTSQTLKLIDPRGASGEADLWTHPLYDLAKLSHSVLGSYDFVNQGLFDIEIDDALRPTLGIDRQVPQWARTLFVERLTRSGLSVPLIRLCEASLFISMLPLHIDRPRQVLGFVLTAIDILDELDRSL